MTIQLIGFAWWGRDSENVHPGYTHLLLVDMHSSEQTVVG